MRTIQSLALLGAALIAACSERQSATAPSTDHDALVSASFIGDRPYAWTFICQANDNKASADILASWHWNDQNGAAIDSTRLSADCYPNDSISGSAVRPANAYGFSACVAFTCKNWTFDPSGSFQAHLKGSWKFCTSHCFEKQQRTTTLITGTLNVDS